VILAIETFATGADAFITAGIRVDGLLRFAASVSVLRNCCRDEQ
jgi:hypothetical protein